jgi:hypothetical protein
MAQERKARHLHFDQQKPDKEPEDAEHSPVTQAQFSRRPPSPEDEYFLAQQLRNQRARQAGGGTAEPPPSPTEQPGPIWRRIIRALTGRANPNWRP